MHALQQSRTANTGDVDLDDDFAPAAAVFPGAAGAGTQGGAGFSSQATMGPPAPRAAAAAATAAASSSTVTGYAVLVTGGLAGFSGRTPGSFGPRVLAPALAGFDPSSSPAAALTFRHGFASGGLGEGLAGVVGAQGAGLRVLAALSPACGPDAAQGLLQLWRTVSGTAGGAPTELLLEALVETMCVAVCSGELKHTMFVSAQPV